MGGQLLSLLGYLIGGVLADRYVEPAKMRGGVLVGSFGSLFGSGPGAGIAFLFAAVALLGGLMSLRCYLSPSVRHLEDELPVHDLA